MVTVVSAVFKQCKSSKAQPGIRGGAAMCSVNDKVYVFGGATRSDMVGDAFRWDGKNWLRLDLGDMVGERNNLGLSGMSATPYTYIDEDDDNKEKDCIVIFGGQDCETSRQSALMWRLTELHIDQVRAKQLHAIGGPLPRNSHGAVSLGEGEGRRLMIWGGANDSGHLDDGFLYDMGKNAWEKLKAADEMPCAREMFSLTRFADKAILIGGKTEKEVPTDLWTYHVEEGWAKSEQQIPFRRMSHTCTAITPAGENQKPMLVVFGGVEFSEDGNMGFPDGIYIGTVDEDKEKFSIGWTAVEGQTTGKAQWASTRFGHSSCSYNNASTMMIFGGSSPASELNDLWKVELENMTLGGEISIAAGN